MLTGKQNEEIKEAFKLGEEFDLTAITAASAFWGHKDLLSRVIYVDRLFRRMSKADHYFLSEEIFNELVEAADLVSVNLINLSKLTRGESDFDFSREACIEDIYKSLSNLFDLMRPYYNLVEEDYLDVEKFSEYADETLSNSKSVSELVQDIKANQQEAQKALDAIRTSAAETAVTVYAKEFEDKAKSMAKVAILWLISAVCFAIATAKLVSYYLDTIPTIVLPWMTSVQYISAKGISISLLLYGMFWCGRAYRSYKNQQLVFEEKATGLRTFQAFIEAAGNDEGSKEIKNQVLLETTRAIYTLTPTGFVDAAKGDGSTTVIDVVNKLKESQ